MPTADLTRLSPPLSGHAPAEGRDQAPRTYAELFSPAVRVQIVVIAVLLLAAFWGPIRGLMVERWISDGNWSHGWLIPVFSLYFLHTRRAQLFRCHARPNWLGAMVLLGSLALYFVSAWVLRMAYPKGVSLVGALFGVTLLLGGWGVIRIAWFPILFLLLAIPLPHQIYVQLTLPLRAFASTVAAAVMPWFAPGLITEAQAVVIDYVLPGSPPGQLNVEEACSGMRLMMAFVTLGVAMAYLAERPAWHRVIMVLSCLPIAVFCNAVRVVVTGLLYINGLGHLAKGTPHQLLGIAMLLIALGLYGLLGLALSHLFIEDPGGRME